MNSTESPIIHLRPKVLSGLLALLPQFPSIKKVILFGSRARGTHRMGSDIDLALEGDGVAADTAKLSWQIDDLGYLETFDILVLDHNLDAEITRRIRNEGVVIYEAPNQANQD